MKYCDSRGIALTSPVPELMTVVLVIDRSALSQIPSTIMPARKRRRSVAFAPADNDNNTNAREVDGPPDGATPAEEKTNSRVWNAFCEEYHEGVVYFAHHLRH